MKLSRRNFVKFLGCSAAMLALPNVSAMAVSKTTIGAPAEMVDVLVTEDTAHLIYASVPKSLAGEYQARLKNDKAFLEQQTTEALGSSVGLQELCLMVRLSFSPICMKATSKQL